MTTFLLLVFIAIAILLILVVLVQRGRGGGLAGAFGSGGGSTSAFGTKTGDVFTTVTVVLFVVFMLMAIWLNFRFQPPTAPKFSDIISAVTSPTTATITWTTDKRSDSQVVYGPTPTYGDASAPDGSMVTAHSVTLTSLPPASTTHFAVRSRDAAGTLGTSPDASFKTPPGDINAPASPPVLPEKAAPLPIVPATRPATAPGAASAAPSATRPK